MTGRTPVRTIRSQDVAAEARKMTSIAELTPVRSADADGAIQELGAWPADEVPGALAGSPSRILLVEPDPALARLLCVGLRSRGWTVDPVVGRGWTPSGSATADYALVVLDLAPGTAGETLLLTTLAARPSLRVIVMSDRRDDEWVVRCFNAGVVDFVAKPFVLVELLARVQARLRPPVAPAPMPDHVVRRSGVSIDMTRRTAELGRGPVKLSNREFVLLEHLMVNEGKVCGREELLSTWDLPPTSRTNLVESYIRRLRVKLGEEVIATVYGRGYAFVGATARGVRVAAAQD
jgi:DNA-binding response OmpR family regulator